MKNCGKYKDNLNLIGPILRKKRNEQHMSLEILSSKLLLLDVIFLLLAYIELKITREQLEIMRFVL